MEQTQIRPRINITEESLKRLEAKAAERGQNINSYLSDLLNGKVTERSFARKNDEPFKEMHLFLPESLHKQIAEDAANHNMSRKDYIIHLLENKGRPIKVQYTNSDLSEIINKIEQIRTYLYSVAQVVEETNEIGQTKLERLIQKTDSALEHVLAETKIERKNRKKLVKVAKELAKEGEL